MDNGGFGNGSGAGGQKQIEDATNLFCLFRRNFGRN